MSRAGVVASLALSLVALIVAAVAVVDPPPSVSPVEVGRVELAELRAAVTELGERLRAVEGRAERPEGAIGASGGERESGLSPGDVARGRHDATHGGDAALAEQVASLAERLESLEEGETIAALARAGETELRRRAVAGALVRVTTPDEPPAERLEGFQQLRRLFKEEPKLIGRLLEEQGLTEADIVLPVVDIARDPRLDVDLRVEALESLHGSRAKELQQPLLEILSYDETPEVRGEALTALMWHIEDAGVREAIQQVSQGDRHEDVQERAQRFLPKVEAVAERAAQAAGEGARGKE